jgi:hypothetical protein
MPSSSFSNSKRIKIIITLGTGKDNTQKTFNGSNNQITLENSAASIIVDRAGKLQLGTLNARIYGMTQEEMNATTTLQWKNKLKIKNEIEIFAVDGVVESSIFKGTIINAWADYLGMPDVYLRVFAGNAYSGQLQVSKPHSFKSATEVSVIMKQLCDEAKLSVVNYSVIKSLSNVYLRGSIIDQIKDLARMADIGIDIEGEQLAMWPKNSFAGTTTQDAVLISKDTGLVGYPTFDGVGITTQVYFNPVIKIGGLIKIETTVTQAAGVFVVMRMNHEIDSRIPNGKWFSSIHSNTLDYAPR